MNDTPITWATFKWLAAQGVPHDVLLQCIDLRMVDGAIAFYEPVDDDVILWSARKGAMTSIWGRAFALGATDNLWDPSRALDHLHIHADPLDWIKDGGRGLVVLRWGQAFDRLRHVPRVAVEEAVLPAYRSAMRPRVPELSVLASKWRAAA